LTISVGRFDFKIFSIRRKRKKLESNRLYHEIWRRTINIMSKEKQHSNDLLRKWLRVDISEKERKALRKQGEDDPFLMDAMDGFQETKGIQSKHLDDTRDRLRKRYTQKSESRGVFYITRIAAALAFIAAGMWVVSYLNDNMEGSIAEHVQETPAVLEAPKSLEKEEVSISEDIEEVYVDESYSEFEIVVNNQGTVPASDIKVEEYKYADLKNETSRKKKNTPTTDIPKTKTTTTETPSYDIVEAAPIPEYREPVSGASIAEPEVMMSDATPPIEDSVVYSIDGIKIANSKVTEASKAEASRAKSQSKTMEAATIAITVITGTIVDENGEGLIGASIVEEGTDNGTVTDIDGNFELEISDLNSELMVSYTGFNTQTVGTQNFLGNNNTIALNSEDMTLDEVVVTGYGSADSRTEIPYARNSSLKKYIKDNLQYPEEAKTNKIEGKVVLEFTVNASGRPENITVKKSLGYGCDEEAIRLIENAPAWETNTSGTKAKHTVKFKM